METKDTLVVIAEELGKALQPLESAAASPDALRDFLDELGWDIAAVPASLNELKAPVQQAAKLGEENEEVSSDGSQQLITAVRAAYEAIAKLSSSDDMANDMKNELPGQLLEYLLVEYLLDNQPRFGQLLRSLGVIRLEEIPAQAGRPAYRRRTFAFSEFASLFTNPHIFFKNAYKWGQSGFRGEEWADALSQLFESWGFTWEIENLNDNALDELTKNSLDPDNDYTSALKIYFIKSDNDPVDFGVGVGLFLLPETTTDKPGFVLMPFASTTLEEGVEITDKLTMVIKTAIDITGGVGIIVRPNKDINAFAGLHSGTPSSISGVLSLLFSLNGVSEPFILIGKRNASRLEIGGISAEGGTRFHSQGKFEVFTEFGIQHGKIVVKPNSEADGFLTRLLPSDGLTADLSFVVGISTIQGLYFGGSGGLEILLPVHIQLGPIDIQGITIAVKPKDGKIPVEISSTIKAELGPLQIVVENLGLSSIFSFPSNSDGNLGPVDFNLGFKPPNGLGLSINAGAVIGGGYLFFDFEKEEYAGALELTIAGFISAKAIGLITTKMPDGSKGFSMLIIITAEFNPPFQLGYGFTLIGVGGLLGLNRTVLLDPLRDGVRTGAVNNIMFPTNVIANAPRIISDLITIFPPYEGKFLIGPMAKIGWGTPTLINLSFGLIIEIPGNIAILGVLKVILPDEKVPIVKIQVAFVGTIDFDKKMLTFDASLYESSILQTMTLEGDMAVRLAWGDQPNFIMTVGGFHPSFTPPPLALPTLRRLAINILNTSIARIRVECYQAVTSNTMQFGARAEIFFDLSACSIDGHIGFDALFQFNPFYFIIELSAGFKLRAIGIDVMTVRVRMSLEGPTPWHAKGTGKVSLLFFDIEADFDKTWGQSSTTTLPDISILPQFIETLQKKEQWSTVLTTGKNLNVSLRKIDEATESLLVLHPAGSLVLQQKLLPLKVNIDKIGNQKTTDVKQLIIESASSGTIPLSIKEVQESFASAQYQNMSDAEKLSRPSFEKMQGGVELSMGGTAIKNGKMVRRKIEYELTIIDKEPIKPLPFGKFFLEIGIMFNHFIKGNSVAKSKLSKSTLDKLQPFEQKLDVQQELFTVAFQNNNKAFNSSATFGSEMEAQSFMQDQIRSNPSLKKEIHIVPQFELQAS